MNAPVIKLEQVSKRYGNKEAVNNISLEINRGSVVAILGPNGAGKTTTMKMMLGLSSATSGLVTVLDQKPNHTQVRQKIGVMLQDVSVMDGLTVREIIRMVRSYYPAPLHADHIEKLTGLPPADLNKRAEKLSGGQKRSLNFALAMAGNPDILFFDEPTVGLDSETRKYFWEQVRKLAQEGKTVIFTTHYLQEADAAADRIILFNRGTIVADGTPEKIKAGITMRTVSFSTVHRSMLDNGSASNKEVVAKADIRALIEKLPDVDRIEYHNDHYILHSKNTDALIRHIIELQLPVHDIRIETGQLDEAYASLTKTVKEDI
ncbi:ABC transporter ATP-binding protein [Paenibacillus pabuli]|uniref:ABC transporter ATP-binding protein n=1 Tax=Paenibacillus pabuli TaxID=1472 RepID=UPI001FFF3E91|nr:ABC transporter ATP-binding protein [Paenibacillus pabuli]UPK44176.1 ABC transporter ATP-binding protein [Paenibacillus pabuli]